MWNISKKHGVELSELLAVNPQIKNSNFIIPGQIINIPNMNTSTYTVVSGDTMWGIAKKHGVELNELMAANPQIKNPDFISQGQKINIPSTSSIPDDIQALEKEVIHLVNVERSKIGSPSLVEDTEINNVARIKSQDFINNNYFSHISPTYGSPFDMLRSYGITFTAAAENIARGQRTAAEVMNFWMRSSGHRSNILSSTYNKIGVGVARDNTGNLYWTQMFIKS